MHPIIALMLVKTVEQERRLEADRHRLAKRVRPSVDHARERMSLVDVFRVSRLRPARSNG